MQSIRAFILAFVIHLIIIGSVVWWMQDKKLHPKVYKEPRILLSLRNPYIINPSVKTIQPHTPALLHIHKDIKAPSFEEKASKPSIETPPQDLSEQIEDIPLPSDRVQRLIDRHYGELFNELSPAEKQYIITNIVAIHRIDRKIGNALLADKPRHTFQDGESNFVEMYLYPNGTLSDITIISEEKNKDLDELTMETVERSYSSYPRPNQKTLIRLHTRIFVQNRR